MRRENLTPRWVRGHPSPFSVSAKAENSTEHWPIIYLLLQYVNIWVDYVFSIPFNGMVLYVIISWSFRFEVRKGQKQLPYPPRAEVLKRFYGSPITNAT